MTTIDRSSPPTLPGDPCPEGAVPPAAGAVPAAVELVSQFQQAMRRPTGRGRPAPESPALGDAAGGPGCRNRETNTEPVSFAAESSAEPALARASDPSGGYPGGSGPAAGAETEREHLGEHDDPAAAPAARRSSEADDAREPLRGGTESGSRGGGGGNATFIGIVETRADARTAAAGRNDEAASAPPGETLAPPVDRPETAERDERDTLGAAVLQSLLTQSSAHVATTAPVVSTGLPGPRVPSLETLVAETLSRVLVSDPLHDGRREVRIEFSREVLPETSVRLWRDQGRLHVEFAASPTVADERLREALPRLGEAIQSRQAERELPMVTLRVNPPGFDAHAGDGRSRQRYVALDERQDEA